MQLVYLLTCSVLSACAIVLSVFGVMALNNIHYEIRLSREATEKAADSHFRFVEMIALQGARQ